MPALDDKYSRLVILLTALYGHQQALEEQGNGRVLIVDGGASKRCALLGDNIAEMAHQNGWSVSPLILSLCRHHCYTTVVQAAFSQACYIHAMSSCMQGIIINGCIRDSEDISKMPLGVKALNTFPLKSSKRDPGLRDIPVNFAGATVSTGDWIYADRDGVLVSAEELKV